MLFLSAVVSLLPFMALASPIVNNQANTKAVADYATISKVLNDIIAQCNSLTAATGKFTGEAIDAVPIVSTDQLYYGRSY